MKNTNELLNDTERDIYGAYLKMHSTEEHVEIAQNEDGLLLNNVRNPYYNNYVKDMSEKEVDESVVINEDGLLLNNVEKSIFLD